VGTTLLVYKKIENNNVVWVGGTRCVVLRFGRGGRKCAAHNTYVNERRVGVVVRVCAEKEATNKKQQQKNKGGVCDGGGS
jgi:hypothetical protein